MDACVYPTGSEAAPNTARERTVFVVSWPPTKLAENPVRSR